MNRQEVFGAHVSRQLSALSSLFRLHASPDLPNLFSRQISHTQNAQVGALRKSMYAFSISLPEWTGWKTQ